MSTRSMSSSSIGGSNARRPWQTHVDMYRKIPNDILEGTRNGSILSYISMVLMVTLIGYETGSYLRPSGIKTDLALDNNPAYYTTEHPDKIRVNFNITMLDLKCDHAVIDVVSVLGTDQNVTANIDKHTVDGNGIKQEYAGRNRDQHDIIMFDPDIEDDLDDLLVDGEDAIPMDEVLFKEYKTKYEYFFVDFYASWCSHCRDLAPTFEVLAEVMAEVGSNYDDDDDSMHLISHEEHNRKDKKRRTEEEKAKHHHQHKHHHDHEDGTIDDDDDFTDDPFDDDDDDHIDDDDDAPIDDDDVVKFSEKDYQHAQNAKLPVVVGKIDCVTEQFLCNVNQDIRMYPTLRLFINGEPAPRKYGGPDYNGHRTVMEMVDWLVHMEELHKNDMEKNGEDYEADRKLQQANIPDRYRKHENSKHYQHWKSKEQRAKRKANYHKWKQSEHPGCQLSGYLMLDKVPGNFHILARSNSHELEPTRTNTSHMIHSLNIGNSELWPSFMPKGVYQKLEPLNGNVYVTNNLHESYHHYLKIVTTKTDNVNLYQIISNSQLSKYKTDTVPEAKFQYDLSPISVYYRVDSKRWHEYITSLFAIIGGIFTVVGMIESSIHSTVETARRRRSSYMSGSFNGVNGSGKKAPNNPYYQ